MIDITNCNKIIIDTTKRLKRSLIGTNKIRIG